jgi:hypothetical protein
MNINNAAFTLLIVMSFSNSVHSATATPEPEQFLAKLYTEALGRIPDQSGWAGYQTLLNSGDCELVDLQYAGEAIYTSSEFLNLGYSNEEKLLSLYRGAFSREPDQSGFDNWLYLLGTGTTWSEAVEAFFSSTEFEGLEDDICSGWYVWGDGDAIDLTEGSSGFTGSQSSLQTTLDSTSSGNTVYIAEREVIRLSSTLTIPAGVTLATYGSPTPAKYARMARIIPASNFPSTGEPLVKLESGAKLEYIWVDGQRGDVDNYTHGQVNVLLNFQSNGSKVRYVKSSNSKGWSNILTYGSYEYNSTAGECTNAVIEYNLITAYSSSNYGGYWTDGISNACDDATIRYNQIIDASDVAIVVFRSHPGTQSSQIHDNTILNAGNPAFGGLVFDPHADSYSGNPSFAGAAIYDNTLWTGDFAHFDIALSGGVHAWFPGAKIGVGTAYLEDNSTGSLSANTHVGIGIDGMSQISVSGNTLNLNLDDWMSYNCSSLTPDDRIAHTTGGHAPSLSGFTNVSLHLCVGNNGAN